MKWTCFICKREEPGTVKDFNKHYMEKHHGNSFKSSREDSRSKRVGVREVRDEFKHAVVAASPEAKRNGWHERPNDSFSSEPSLLVWFGNGRLPRLG
jgi:hypothetical protein